MPAAATSRTDRDVVRAERATTDHCSNTTENLGPQQIPRKERMNSFSIVPGHPSSPVILHVPHASRTIPPHVREQLLLADVRGNRA